MVTSFNREWRDNAIETLLANDIDTIASELLHNSTTEYLYNVLNMGFKGYSNMFDEELEKELLERDISTVFGDNDD